MRAFIFLALVAGTIASVDVQRAARIQCRSDTLDVLPQMLVTMRGAPDIHILARMHSALSRWIYRPCTLLEADEPDLSLVGALPYKLDLSFMGDMVDPTFGDKGLPDQIECRAETAEDFLASTMDLLRQCTHNVQKCRERDAFTSLASRFIKWEDNPCKFRNE
jgi:hypothetical protein